MLQSLGSRQLIECENWHPSGRHEPSNAEAIALDSPEAEGDLTMSYPAAHASVLNRDRPTGSLLQNLEHSPLFLVCGGWEHLAETCPSSFI
jgi:hypothetical protein